MKIFILLIILFQTFCSSQTTFVRTPELKQMEWNKKKFDLRKYASNRPDAKNILILDPIFLPYKNLTGEAVGRELFKDGYSLSTNFRKEYMEFPPSSVYFLIPYLVENGFNVYLFTYNELTDVDLSKFSKEIPNLLKTLQKDHQVQEISLLGLSLGGQALASFYETYNPSATDLPNISKLAFIGTGFDYNYTNSLVEKMKKASKTGGSIQCVVSEKENLCNRYITSIYLKRGLNQIFSYPILIPKLESDPNKNFSSLGKDKKPVLVIYGKLDGISPEESVLPPFFPERKDPNAKILIWEASTANGLEKDYDHFDLFLNEKSHKEIFPVLSNWLKDEK